MEQLHLLKIRGLDRESSVIMPFNNGSIIAGYSNGCVMGHDIYKDYETGLELFDYEVEVLPLKGQGAIISGYQGVGKTTMAKNNIHMIDLESSNTFINGVRPDNWEQSYIAMALSLSQQGYIVFVSSHKVVQEELLRAKNYSKARVAFLSPHTGLKDEWLEKLKERYEKEPTTKNFRALAGAKDGFEEQVETLDEFARKYHMPLGKVTSYETVEQLVNNLVVLAELQK